jgi:hypothetical protein
MGRPRKKFWLDEVEAKEDLSEVEKSLHDKFFAEFLHDFDIQKAAMRIGFSPDGARKHGPELYCSEYVQNLLKDFYSNEKNVQKADVTLVKMTLRDVMVNGSDKDRISAANQMKGILGIDAPLKTQQIGAGHMGGILRLPAVANLNEWEKIAERHQKAVMTEQKDENTG